MNTMLNHWTTISRLGWMLALAAMLLAAPVFSTTPALVTQDERDGQGNRNRGVSQALRERGVEDLRILILKHTSARDIRRTVVEVGLTLQAISVDERTNSLILAGTIEQLEAAEKLIAQLDQPIEAGHPARSVRVIRLSPGRLTPGTMAAIDSIIRQPGVKIAMDPSTDTIVVEASEDIITNLAELTARLDQPQARPQPAAAPAPSSYRVRVIWLIGGLKADERRPLAPDLKEVEAELAKLGLTDLSMQSQVLVRGSTENHFMARANPSVQSAPIDLTLNGTFLPQSTDRMARLQLEVMARQTSAVAEGATLVTAMVGSTVEAPLGHFVVLGLTPIGAMSSVFVVQVTAESASEPQRVW